MVVTTIPFYQCNGGVALQQIQKTCIVNQKNSVTSCNEIPFQFYKITNIFINVCLKAVL